MAGVSAILKIVTTGGGNPRRNVRMAQQLAAALLQCSAAALLQSAAARTLQLSAELPLTASLLNTLMAQAQAQCGIAAGPGQQQQQLVQAPEQPAQDCDSHTQLLVACQDLASMPVRVRAHYTRMLLDWTCATLLRGGSSAQQPKHGQQPTRSKATQGAAGTSQEPQPETPAKQDAQYWLLLALLLKSPDIPPSHQLSANLVSAMAAACQAQPLAQPGLVAGETQPDGHLPAASHEHGGKTGQHGFLTSEALPAALLEVLATLVTKFHSSFRPSLEHTTTFTEAVLRATPPASPAQEVPRNSALSEDSQPAAAAAETGARLAGPPSAWVHLGLRAVGYMRGMCQSHPNQRKVFTVAGRMLVPLSVTAFPDPTHGPGTAVHQQLAFAAGQLLDAILFHPVHIKPLAGVCTLEMSLHSEAGADSKIRGPADASEKAEKGDVSDVGDAAAEEDSAGAADAAPQQNAAGANVPRSFHAQLFQVLQQQLAAPDATSLSAVLRALPWLLQRFAAALRKHRKLAAADAAATAEAAAQRYDPDDPTNVAGAVHLSADFHFAAMLLRPLIQALQGGMPLAQQQAPQNAPQPDGLPGDTDNKPRKRRKWQVPMAAAEQAAPSTSSGAAASQQAWSWAVIAEGAAELVAGMKQAGVYRPTEDRQGTHRQLLASLSTTILQRFGDNGGKQAAAAMPAIPAQNPAAHAALAAQHACGSSQDAVAAVQVLGSVMDLEHRALQPQLQDIWALLWDAASQGSAGARVAIRVACSLLRAYCELRQLEHLLQSLVAALTASCPQAAVDVVCSAAFIASLKQAVFELPSGQAAAIVRFVSNSLATLDLATASAIQLLPMGELYVACLEAVHVELTTSPAVAKAISSLLTNALSHRLVPVLAALAEQQAPTDQAQLLQVLLRLYNVAVKAHGRCAALQPQIVPLPGQGFDAASSQQGYFSALGPKAGASDSQTCSAHQPYTLERVAAALQHRGHQQTQRPKLATASPAATTTTRNQQSNATSSSTSSGKVTARLAFVQCALERLRVLHEQLLRCSFTCQVITVDSGAKAADAQQPKGARAVPKGEAAARTAATPSTAAATAVNRAAGAEACEAPAAEAAGHAEHAERIQQEMRGLTTRILAELPAELPADLLSAPGWTGVASCLTEQQYVAALWSSITQAVRLLSAAASAEDITKLVRLAMRTACLEPDREKYDSPAVSTLAGKGGSGGRDSGTAGTFAGTHAAQDEQRTATVGQQLAAASQGLLAQVDTFDCAPVRAAWVQSAAAELTMAVQTACPSTSPQAPETGPEKRGKKRKALPGSMTASGSGTTSRDSLADCARNPQQPRGLSSVLAAQAAHMQGSLKAAEQVPTQQGKRRKGSNGQPSQQPGAAPDCVADEPSTQSMYSVQQEEQEQALQQMERLLEIQAQLPSGFFVGKAAGQLALHLVQCAVRLQEGLATAAAAASSTRSLFLGTLEAILHLLATVAASSGDDAAVSALSTLGTPLLDWLLQLCLSTSQAFSPALAARTPAAASGAMGTMDARKDRQWQLVERLHERAAAVVYAVLGHCMGVRAHGWEAAAGAAGQLQEKAAAAVAEDQLAAQGTSMVQHFAQRLHEFWQERQVASVEVLAHQLQPGQQANGGHQFGPRGLLTEWAMAVMLEAVAGAAANALDAAKAMPASSALVTGPTQIQRHCVDAEAVLAICTTLEQPAVAALSAFASAVSAPAPAAMDAASANDSHAARVAVHCCAGLYGTAAHLISVRGSRATAQSGQRDAHAGGLTSDERAPVANQDQPQDAPQAPSPLLASLGAHVSGLVALLQRPWRLCQPVSASASSTSDRMQATPSHSASGAKGTASSSSGGAPGQQLPLSAALRLVGYLETVGWALPCIRPEPPAALHGSLVALHLRLLRTLVPTPQAPGPLRHATSSLMGLPTLPASGAESGSPGILLHKAVVLSLRELVSGSSKAQTAQLCEVLLGALRELAGGQHALPIVEAVLVVLEAPTSQEVHHSLSQQGRRFAAGLQSFLSRISSASPGTQAEALGAGCEPAAGQGEHAAVLCTALRGLESMFARESVFRLPASQVALALLLPVPLFERMGARSKHAGSAVAGWEARDGAGVFTAACSLLAALLRHHAKEARRCMALLIASLRQLLHTLIAWETAAAGTMGGKASRALTLICATELARVYSAVAEHKETMGKYCVHILADYVTLAVAPATQAAVYDDEDSRLGSLSPEASGALRQGAYALYGACTPLEVQHMYMVLSQGAGGSRRQALADLRRDYEKDYKYTGKV